MVNNRSISFDVIRIVACLCILIIHFNASVSGWEQFNSFQYPNHLIPNNVLGGVYLGDLGVGIFFILSGACLQLSSKFSQGLSISECLKFWRKRAQSIYPTFWIAFLFATVVHFLWYKGMSMSGWKSLIASFLGLDGYLGFMIGKGGGFYQVGEWFLGCIIIIYIFYPFLAYLLRKVPLLSTILVFGIYFYLIPNMSKHWFFLVVPYIWLGMMFTKYLYKKNIIQLCGFTIIVLLMRLIWADLIIGPTITLITSWVSFVVIYLVSEWIEDKFSTIVTDTYRHNIEIMSILTYPAFLIHHKLISLLASLYDLSYFPYRYTVMLFVIYIIMVWYLSVKLYNASKLLTEKLF